MVEEKPIVIGRRKANYHCLDEAKLSIVGNVGNQSVSRQSSFCRAGGVACCLLWATHGLSTMWAHVENTCTLA